MALNSFATDVLPPTTMEIYFSHCTMTSSQLSRAALSDAGVKYRGLFLLCPFVKSPNHHAVHYSPQLIILLNIVQVSGNCFPYDVDDAHKVDDGGEQWGDHLQLVASSL